MAIYQWEAVHEQQKIFKGNDESTVDCSFDVIQPDSNIGKYQQVYKIKYANFGFFRGYQILVHIRISGRLLHLWQLFKVMPV